MSNLLVCSLSHPNGNKSFVNAYLLLNDITVTKIQRICADADVVHRELSGRRFMLQEDTNYAAPCILFVTRPPYIDTREWIPVNTDIVGEESILESARNAEFHLTEEYANCRVLAGYEDGELCVRWRTADSDGRTLQTPNLPDSVLRDVLSRERVA